MKLEEQAGDRQLIVTRISPALKAAKSHSCQYCGNALEPVWDDENNLLLVCGHCTHIIEVV